MDDYTVLAIGNEALAMLGAQAVAQVDEGSDIAATLFRIGPTTLAQVLTAHPWACTLAQPRLTRLADPPGNGFRYAYAMPAGLLVFRRALASPLPGAPSIGRWRIVGEELHTDAEEVYADVQREPPLEAWPPHLRAFARAALAADLALTVTGSGNDAQFWTQRAWGSGDQSLLQQARRVEAQQHTPAAMEDWPLLAARFGG
jgi:hypothetical protein